MRAFSRAARTLSFKRAAEELYTLGIRLFVGRCHAAALLPEVVGSIEAKRLRPELVTTRLVDWSHAPDAWLEPAIKLVVRRSD